MKLSDIDAWLEKTKTEKDKEYDEAMKEALLLSDIDEMNEEDDL